MDNITVVMIAFSNFKYLAFNQLDPDDKHKLNDSKSYSKEQLSLDDEKKDIVNPL